MPFLRSRKLCIAVSAVVILAGLGGYGNEQRIRRRILNYSMEFQGGTSTNVTFNEDMSLDGFLPRWFRWWKKSRGCGILRPRRCRHQ